MKCPNCSDISLVITDRQGVEIDYCPTCRGIWLDRGEIDKLLDRAAAAATTTMVTSSARKGVHPDFEDSDFRRSQPYMRDRKKTWLNEIFD